MRRARPELANATPLDSPSDAGDADGAFNELLERCRAGDGAAFSVLWRRLNPPLLRYLRVMAPAASEDVASDTWLEVARSLDRFSGNEAGFRGWMFAIARHRVLDWTRRQARRLPTTTMPEQFDAAVTEDDVASTVMDRMSTKDALALIATLPPAQAEAVTLRVVGDLGVAEVARLMDREPGAVRVLTHRGLQRLAQQLSGQRPALPAPDGVTA